MKYYNEKNELCIHDTETNVTDGFPRLDIDLDSNTSDTEIPIIGNLSNPMSMEEKYAYYSPTLNRISDLLQRFGTEQTKKYAKELLQVEERIRFGKAIFPETQTKDTSSVSLEETYYYVQLDLNNVHYITKTDILEDDTGSVQVDSNKVEIFENAGSMDDNEPDHVKFNKAENIEKGEFYMKFKSKVRSRGRPKGSSRVRYGSKKKQALHDITGQLPVRPMLYTLNSFRSNFCHQEGSGTIFKYSVILG